ncbi:phosphotransferase, partial [Mobilicoccus sp.]|uniref:phosphotransferase n=1 Tax=Mobilicoccus sp. TaxID=2034349 RepID=UPI0028A5B2AD
MKITPHHLAALADAAVPGLLPVGLHMVAENIGERFHVGFVVDDEDRAWVVRLPADRVSAASQEASIPFLQEIARHLPYAVPEPAGTAALSDGRPAMVYPYLHGRIVDFALLPSGPGIATGIGEALAALHDVPVGALDETGVPVYDAEACRHRLVSDVDRGGRTGLVPPQLLTRWERTLEDAAWWDFETVPVHGYLSNAHLLTDFPTEDTSSGRVSAMVSWEGAKIGDPAEDLAALARSAPADAVETVFGAYAQHRRMPVDPHLRERARLLGELRLLSRLLAAHSSGDEPAVVHVVRTMRRLVDLLAEDSFSPHAAGHHSPVPVSFEDDPVDEDWYSAGGASSARAAVPVTPAHDTPADAATPADWSLPDHRRLVT